MNRCQSSWRVITFTNITFNIPDRVIRGCQGVREVFPREFVVCITGAASGIGRAAAVLLAEDGVRLVLADRDAEGLLSVEATIGAAFCQVVAGDLTQEDVANRVIATAIATYGRLDGIIFAAGSSGQGSLSNTTLNDFGAAMNDNVVSHLLLSQAVLRRHAEHHPERLECSLVYVVSKAAVAPSTGFGAYPLAKASELQLARIVALEGGKFGVRANAVNPGAVLTRSKFWESGLLQGKARGHGVSPRDLERFYAERTLLGVTVTPEDVARVTAFLVSPWSRATTGAIIAVDGGLAASFGR